MYRLAINGYGRIGRSVLRALLESPYSESMQIVAINEPADCETICHLTQYDSTHGRLKGTVELTERDQLRINDQSIKITHEELVENLCWKDIDLVLECSGSFTDRKTAESHLVNGAGKVLFSQPAEADVDLTVVYGVNHEQLKAEHCVISNASCTTNGSVPVLKVLNDAYGIECATITTIHSAMNDQPVIDAYHHTDLRKTRSASQSMIPVETGLAKGIERILPELTGLLSAQAVRIPTMNVSAMDITVLLKQQVDVEAVNALMKAVAEKNPGVIGYCDQPLASIDFNHDERSAIVDATQTRVSGDKLLKLFVWFDNEWAYANRMLDVAAYISRL